MIIFTRIIKRTGLVLCLLLLSVVVFGCGSESQDQSAGNGEAENAQKGTLVFADAGWDSIRFHNDAAGFIIENGYGYNTDVIPGSTPTTFTGLRKGDIDIYMEAWKQNIIDQYNEGIEKGEIKELSVNFADDAQGLFVPTYVIKGDKSRGIEPMAPGLKSVQDLPEYWELFKDPEEPSKGRIYGSIPGWAADEILYQKYQTYGLDKTYNYFRPGSGTALATSLANAYKKGEPWVGYYWTPTWISGKYDITLLKEAKYSDEKWNNGYACQWPGTEVTVVVNSSVLEKAPDVAEFLRNYHTSSKLTAEGLAYMQDNEATTKEAAKWFLKEHQDLWTKWVPQKVAEKVKAAL